jgi:hypothetical protein
MPNVRLPRRRFLALSAASLGGTLLTGCDRLSESSSKRVFPRRSGLLIASSGCLAAGMRSLASSRPAMCRRFLR